MMMLMQEGWWSFVAPGDDSDGSSTSSDWSTIEVDEVLFYGVARPRVLAPNRVAQCIKAGRLIISTLGDGVIIHVVHLTNQKEIWDRLDAKYNVKNLSRCLALKEKLYSLRFIEEKTIDSHLQEINLLVYQLARLGTTVEDEDLVNLTLNSLPKSWATFRSIHKASPPSFHVLEGLLVQEDLSRDLDRTREESEEVLYVKSTSQRPGRGRSVGRTRGWGRSYQRSTAQSRDDQNWKNTPTCHRCGKVGHIARGCPQTEVERKIRELKSQLAKLKLESESVHLVKDDIEEDTKEATVNACMAAFTLEDDEWFLNSGASSHVIGNARLVTNMTLSTVPSIRTANAQILPVTAKGSIRIQEVTGEIKSIRNVLYVPCVRSNLLSIGKFTYLGHVVLFNSM
jgi:hypothetical protein